MTRRRCWTYCERCRDYHDAYDARDTCTAPVIVPPLAVTVAVVIGLAAAAFLWRWVRGAWL